MDVTADTDDLREQIDARLARAFDVDLDPSLPTKKAMQDALDRRVGRGLKILTQLELPQRKVMQEQLDRRVGKGLKLKIGSLDLPVKRELQTQLDRRVGTGLKLKVNIDVNDASFLPVVTKAKAAQKAITALEAKEEAKRETARENALVRLIESELKGRRNLGRQKELLEERTNARLDVLNEQHFNRLNAQTAAAALRREVIEANLAARLTAQNDAFEKRRQFAAEATQRKLQSQASKPILQSVLLNANELNRSLADFDRTVSRVLRTSLVAFTAWSAGVEIAVAAAATAAVVSFARVELAATQTASVVATQQISDEIIAQGQAISDFSTIVTTEFDKIVTEADKIALDTLFDTGDIIGGIDAAVKAGLDLDAALQAAGASANFAQVNGLDAADAAEQLAAGLAAAGIEAEKSSELIDKISFVAASSIGDANDFLEAFANRAAASAQAFGYTNDEVLVFLSLLGQTGTLGREAGTQANIVFRELGRAAGRAGEAWKKYGIDANAPLAEQLVKLAAVAEQVRATQGRAGVAGLAEELGLTYRSISSILQVLPQVNKLGLEGLRNLERGIKSSQGLVDQQAEQVRNTISFQWDNLLNTTAINARRFAKRLQPELSDLFDVFGGQGGLIDQAGDELEEFGDRFAETIERITAFVQTDDFKDGVSTFVEAIEVTLRGVSDSFEAFSAAFNDAEPAQSTFEAIADTTLAFAQTAATVLPAVADILGEIFDFLIDNADAFETFAKLTVGVFLARKAFNLVVGPALASFEAIRKARNAMIAWSAAENVGAFKSAAVVVATQLGIISKSADVATASFGRLAAAQTVADVGGIFPTLGAGGRGGIARGATGRAGLQGLESQALLGAGLGGEASRLKRGIPQAHIDDARMGANLERIASGAVKATSALRIFGRALGVVGLAIAAFEVGIGFVQGFGEQIKANFGEGSEGAEALKELKPLIDLVSDAASALSEVLRDAGRAMGEDFADAVTDVAVVLGETVAVFTDADASLKDFADSVSNLSTYLTPGGRQIRETRRAIEEAEEAARSGASGTASFGDSIRNLTEDVIRYNREAREAAAVTAGIARARAAFEKRLSANASNLEQARQSLASINEEIALAQSAVNTAVKDDAAAAATEVRDLSAEAAAAVARMSDPARARAADALVGKITNLGSSFRLTRQGVAILEASMPGLDAALEKQRAAVEALDEQLNALRNTQLKGSKEFSDQLFALDQQQKQLQLNRLDLVAAGAGDTDPRVQAIDAQLTELQRQAERVQLTESLQLDPLRRKLDETFNPRTELPFEQIVAQFKTLTAERTAQNNELVRQEQQQAAVNAQLERARTAFEAVDQAARAAADAQAAAGSSASAAAADLQTLYAEREKALRQVRRFNLQREQLKDEALELPRTVAAHAGNAARVVGGFLEGFRNAYYQRFKPLSHVARKDLEDSFQPNLAPNGEAVMVGFGQGMKQGFGTPQTPNTPAWYLNVFIPKWIAENKGPISYDQGILVPAGHAVMEGFGRGLRDGFSQVQGFVREVGPSLGEMITAKAFGDRTATIMADIAVGKKPDIEGVLGDLRPAAFAFGDWSGPLDASLGFLHRSLSLKDTTLMAQQLAALFNTPISSLYRPGATTTSGNPSNHGFGLAADFSNGNQPTPEMDALYAALLPYKGKLFSELLYRTMVGGNHFNHVHAAWLRGAGFSIHSNKVGKPSVTNIPGASDRIDRAISEASAKYGVELALLAAVAKQESRFNPSARSPAGAGGLFQFMPATAAGFGINPFNVEQASEGGARFLRNLLRMFGGRYDLALAGYNAGPGAVQRYDGIPPFPETRNYVRLVLDYLDDFRKLFGGARELGGPTMAGKAYLVGERGPELHVPRTNGTVIPADQTARMLSGAPQYIDNSVTTVTTAATDPDIVAEKIDRKKRDRFTGVNFR